MKNSLPIWVHFGSDDDKPTTAYAMSPKENNSVAARSDEIRFSLEMAISADYSSGNTHSFEGGPPNSMRHMQLLCRKQELLARHKKGFFEISSCRPNYKEEGSERNACVMERRKIFVALK